MTSRHSAVHGGGVTKDLLFSSAGSALIAGAMWKCQTCGEAHEDQFDSCWKCSTRRAPVEPGDDGSALESETPLPEEAWPRAGEMPVKRDPYKVCQRCGLALELYGHDRLTQGSDFLKSLFINTYVTAWKCPRCQRVEFYACE